MSFAMNDVPPGSPTVALTDALAHAARSAPESGIVEVANYGRGREGLIPLWIGEGDLPTPSFICEAATRALAAGGTVFTPERGVTPPPEGLAPHYTMLFGPGIVAGGVFVT